MSDISDDLIPEAAPAPTSAFVPAPRPPISAGRGNREPVGAMVSSPGSFSTASADEDFRGRSMLAERQARVDESSARAQSSFDRKSAAAALEDQMIQKGLDYYKGEDGALRPKRDEAGNVLYREGDWAKAKQSDGSWAYQRRSKTGKPETKRATITSNDASDPNLYYDFGDAGREVAGHVDDLSKSSDPEVALAATKHRSQWASAQRKAAMKPLEDQVLTLEQERAASEVQRADLALQTEGLSAKRAELEAKATELKAAGAWKSGWLSGGDLTSDAKAIQAQLDKIDADSAALSTQATELASPWEKRQDFVGAKAAQLASVKAEKDAWEAEAKLSAYGDVAEERRAVLRKLGRSEKDDPILEEIAKVQQQFGARTTQARAGADALNPFNAAAPEPQLASAPAPEQVEEQAKEKERGNMVADIGLSFMKGAQNVAEGIDLLVSDFTPLGWAYRKIIGRELRPTQSVADVAGAAAGAVVNASEGRGDLAGDILSVNPGEGRSEALTNLQSTELKRRRAAAQELVRRAGEGKEGWEKFAAQFGTAFREGISDPRQLTNTLVEQAAMLVPSQVGASIATKLGVVMKLSPRLMGWAAKAGAVGGGAAAQGADVASGVKEELAEALGNLSAEQASQIPEIAGHMESGNTLEQAKAQFLVDEARRAFAIAAPASLALNLIPGSAESLIARMAAGQVKAGATGSVLSVAKGAAKSALVEPLTEVPEELAGQLATNLSVRKADPGRELTAGFGETAAQATIAGVGMGGGVGAVEARTAPKREALRELRAVEQATNDARRETGAAVFDLSNAIKAGTFDGVSELMPMGQVSALLANAEQELAAGVPVRSGKVGDALAQQTQHFGKVASYSELVRWTTARMAATQETATQVQAIPDFVPVLPADTDPALAAAESMKVKTANRDAATALVKIANGIQPGALTEGEQQGLALVGEAIGSAMVDFSAGGAVVTDKARTWLSDLAPASAGVLDKTETQQRERIKVSGEKPQPAAPVQSSVGPAAKPAPVESGFKMVLGEADLAGPVTPARVLRSFGRADSVARGEGSSKSKVLAARQTAARVNRLLSVFRPIFSDVVVTDDAVGSGGFVVSGEGRLNVHLGDLTHTANEKTLLSDDRLAAIFTEEAAHVVSKALEAQGKWNPAEAWAKLSAEEQALFSQAYLRDERGVPRAQTDKDSAWRLAHETVRMFVQGRAKFTQDGKVIVDGQTTEQTASRGLLEMLKDILSKIQDFLVGNAGTKGAQEMRELADQIGGILEGALGVENFAYGDSRNQSPPAVAPAPAPTAAGQDTPNVEQPSPSAGASNSAVATPNGEKPGVEAKGQPGESPADRSPPLAGEKINSAWTAFSAESGSLGIPRAQMPQIKAESRGALTQFLLARGITHEQQDVLPGSLKPTQAEFSPVKVAKAREFPGGDRAILVSADDHVVDGHHQWMAKLADKPTEPMRVIRLNAPIRELLGVIPAMPSADTAGGAGGKSDAADMVLGAAKLTETGPRAAMQVVSGKLSSDSRAALAAELGIDAEQVGDVESVTHKGRVFQTVNIVAGAEAFPTSHNFDGTVRNEYPQDLQPRDRSGEVYLAQQRQMAANPNLAEESLKGTTDRGVPIVALVDGRPVVVMGNGRANAKALMYQSSALAPVAQKFAADVEKVSASKGIAAGVVGAIAKPTLYRVALDAMPVEALREASKESNEFAGAATNAVEQARQDAGRMSATVLSFLVPGFELDAGRNTPFRQEFVRSVIGSSAANITEGDLVRRIEAALFAKAFSGSAEGAGAFSRLLNEDDAGVRALIGAMMDVAPKVAALNTAIADGSLHPLRISDEVARAVEDIAVALRDKPSSQSTATAMDGLLSQQEMPGITERTPLQDAVLRFLVGNRGSKAKIASVIESYIQLARAEGDPKQMGMFGDVEVRTPEQLWTDAVTLSKDEVLASTRAAAAGRINDMLMSGRSGSGSMDFFGELNLTEPVKVYAESLPAEVKASKAAIIKQAAKDIPAIQGNLFAATEIARVAAPELFPAADEGQDAPDATAVDGQASPEGQQANLEDDDGAPDEVAFAQERAAELENDPNADEASVVADVEPLEQDEVRAHEAKFGPDETLPVEQLFEKYRPAAERMAATRYSNIPGATKAELMQQARLILWESASGVSAQTQQTGNAKFADYGVGKNGTKRTFWQFAGNLLRRRLATMFTKSVRQVSRELSMDAGSVGIDGESGGDGSSADGSDGGGTIGDYLESGDNVAENAARSDSIGRAQEIIRSAMAIMGDREAKALRAAMATEGYGDLLKNVQAATGVNSIQHASIILKDAQKKLKGILDSRAFKLSDLDLASGRSGLPPIPDWSDRALNPAKWKADANAWSAEVPDVVAFRSMLHKDEAFFTSKNPRVGEGPWRVTRIMSPGTEQMRPMGHLSFPERDLAFQYALAVGEPDMGLLFSMPADVATPEGRDVWDAQLTALMSGKASELFSSDDMEGAGDTVAYPKVSVSQMAKLSNTLLFPFLGNKSALTEKIANVILAGAKGASLVGDMMAGAGYYGNVLARLGAGAVPRIHNEWNGLRVATFAAIKSDPEGVIAANKKWADEFQRLDDETLANGRPENERMQEVVRKTDAAARAAIEPLLPENAAELAKTAPVPLPRTAEVAGLYLALQNITDLGKPLELEFGDDGKLKPLMTKKGTLANYRTGASYAKLIREYAAQIAGTEVSQADGYKAIGEQAKEGSFFFLDPGYTGDSSNYAKPLEGQTSREAFQGLLEGVAMDAWRKGAKLLITNNWDYGTVLLLRRLGFTVLKEYRKGDKPELVAFNYDPQSGQLYDLDGSTRSAVESRGAAAGQPERDAGGVRGSEPAAVRGGERNDEQRAPESLAGGAVGAAREDAPGVPSGERAGGVGAGADRVAAPIGDQAEIDAAFAELMRGLPAQLDEIRANQAFETDGTRVQGRPDLANPGGADETARNAWNAVDEARKPSAVVENREDARNEAERMIAADRSGVLRALLAKARAGEAFGSTVENYASLILANELVQKGAAGDLVAMEQAAILQSAHRESRSNVARILGAGADVFKKPADRLRDFLSGALFTPNPQARKQLEGVWKASEKAREVDRLKGEIAKLESKASPQSFAAAPAPVKAEDSAQLLRLRKQLGEAMERSTREQDELKAIKERIKKVEKAMPGVTLDHIINSEAYFRLIGDSFSKNAVDAIGAGEVERRIVQRIRKGQDNAYIASGMGVDAAMVAKVRGQYLAEVERRLRTIGDAALDPDNFDTGDLKSGQAGALSEEERNRRIAIIMQRMGAISDDQAKVRTQKGVARKARVAKERQLSPEGAVPPPAPSYPADAAGSADTTGGNKQLVLGEDAEAMPPLFDGTNAHEVAAVSRAIQAADGNFFDMAFEAWINGILSGPMTQAANIVGNGFNAGWEFSVKRMGEAIVNLAVKDPNAPRMGEFKWMMKALQPSFAKAWAHAVTSFDTEVGGYPSDTLDAQYEIPEASDKTGGVKASIPGKTGRVVRIPGRLLMAADAFFKSAIAHIHVAAEASRAGMAQGLKGPDLAKFIEKESEPGSVSWGKATALATELTFQDDHKDTGMGRLLQGITSLREWDAGNGIKPLRFIAPFIRTPFNIFQQGLRQSPAGSIMLAARLGSAGLYYLKDGKPFAKSFPTPELIKRSVEQLMAWAFVLALYGAAAGDDDDADKGILITGSMSDKRSGVNQLNQRAGIGAYTLRIGGAQVRYGRIEPLATMLGTAIDMITSLKGGNGAFDSFGNFVASAGAAADEKTFLRGWTDLSNAVTGETKFKGYVAQQIATLVPNLFKQPVRNLDPVVRQRGTGFFDTLASSVYSPAANPKIDVWGKEVEKPGAAAARLTVPAEIRETPEVNRVDKLLLNWNASLTPEERKRDGWAPQPPARQFKVNGAEVELGADAYEKYSRRTGELASRLLAGASLNVSKPTADDIRKIKTAFELARVQARREVVGGGAVDM